MPLDNRIGVRGWARFLLAWIFTCLGTLSAWGLSPAVSQEITTFHQFYGLPTDQAIKGLPLRIKGVVVCYDQGWNQLYINDGDQTVWLSPQLFQEKNLQVGLSVELTGSSSVVQGGLGMTNLHLQLLGHGDIPQPKRLAIPQLNNDFGQWIETHGRVRVAENSPGRLSLVVEDKSQTCLVYVMGLSATNDFKWLKGCNVSIRGINASRTVGGRLEAASVFATGLNGINVLERPTPKPKEDPVISVENLLDRHLGAWTNEPVHLNGLVTSYKQGESMVIKDATGSIRAQVIQTTLAQLDERVDVWGYLTAAPGENILRGAYFERQYQSGESVLPSAAKPAIKGREISRIHEISKMLPEAAAHGFRVRLRGVVTYADPDWRNCFIQDQEGAVYVDLNQRDVRVGQWVEVTGQTSSGGFVPEVVAANFQILGTTNLPAPVKADLGDLANGHLDSHWVQLEGVVRRVTQQWGHVTLILMTPKGRFRAILPGRSDELVPDLIDALVSIQGACSSEVNTRGQLNGVTLHVPGPEQITVLESVPADPFGVRATPISSVATFDPTRLAGRRVKVSGSVTQIIPGQGFYVQDASDGLLVKYAQTNDLHVGDKISALGFPSVSDFSPYLEEAVFLRSGTAPLPKPQFTTAEEILLHGKYDATLVSIEGRLVQSVPNTAHPKLALQSGSIIFSATLATQPDRKKLSYQVGSVLRLTGVCSIQGGESHEPETFRLLVSGPQDIAIVSSPPWWTVQYALVLAGGLGFGALLAWGWSRSLRRQVRAQTEVIHRNQQELVAFSRKAGMSEVATGVLHNVGNVLNSVNVCVNVLSDRLIDSQVGNLTRVCGLLDSHRTDLGTFLTSDPKGSQIPNLLPQLASAMESERTAFTIELQALQKNVDHIKEIVAMQQSYAKVSGLIEDLPIESLIEDALRMNEETFSRHGVTIKRTFAAVPAVRVDKHKVLQILINLLRNAKHAMAATDKAGRLLSLGVSKNAKSGRVEVTVCDNGIGIDQENLTRIFSHGFTTKKDGHGFGLHSGALAAKEMGGSLLASSEGPGKGATFTLELPIADK